MTVGFTAIAMVKNGRLEEALTGQKRYAEALASVGAQNVRTMILQSSTPIRLVTTFEAENQAALGAVLDAWGAHPTALETQDALSDSGPTAGYTTETWFEV